MPSEAAGESNSGAPTGSSGNAAASWANHGELANRPRPLMPNLLVLALWPHDTLASHDATEDPMLEEFISSVAASQIVTIRSLTATLAAAYLEDEPPQHADFVLQMPPPCPIQWAVGSPPVSPQQGCTQVSASMRHGEGYPPSFGPVDLRVDVDPLNTSPVDQ
jgi:hypothetical protein